MSRAPRNVLDVCPILQVREYNGKLAILANLWFACLTPRPRPGPHFVPVTPVGALEKNDKSFKQMFLLRTATK